MKPHRTRKIAFKELIKVGEWSIKTYTIAKNDQFDFSNFYPQLKAQLPDWLALKNGFNDDHEHIGFLIIHAGTEGIFSLINWWVGDNMLNTHIYMTEYDDLHSFKRISGTGLAPCIWELEVVEHERVAWMKHILLRAPECDFDAYLEDVCSRVL